MKNRVTYLILIAALTSEAVLAVEIKSKEELAMLPPICAGSLQGRQISGDQTPVSEYKKMYGLDFIHLHHYCWALNTENKYYRDPTSYYWRNALGSAIGDLDYVITNSSPTFVFLPDVYLAKARIFSLQKQNPKAMAAALQAINARPDFERAYVFLSDLYINLGDKNSAVKTLQSGLERTPDSKPLLRRLTKLGGTPPKPLAQPEKVEVETPQQTSPEARASANTQESAATTSPDSASPLAEPVSKTEKTPEAESPQINNPQPENPYCRFCP